MGDKPISYKDKDGNFVSAADVWNAEKLEELFNKLNPNRKFRLEREKMKQEKQGQKLGNSQLFAFQLQVVLTNLC